MITKTNTAPANEAFAETSATNPIATASLAETSARRARAGQSSLEGKHASAHEARAARRSRAKSRRTGFSLIEIMAVVLIMGLLAGIVGTFVVGQINSARVSTARAQIKQIESALTFYQMDNGRFPPDEQGLDALVNRPSSGPEPRNYRAGGYLQGGAVPKDPWDNPYNYRFPGDVNRHSFDLWSLGADGQPGGDETNADIGNWSDELETAG